MKITDVSCRVRVAVRVCPALAVGNARGVPATPRFGAARDNSTFTLTPFAGTGDLAAGILATETADDKTPRSRFQFNDVFWSTGVDANPATQEDVYQKLGPPIARHALEDGFNSCLFAYGQTGSGKTHSMVGPASVPCSDERAGIIPRLCQDVLSRIHEERARDSDCRFAVTCSFAEVYCERVRDLLPKDGAVPSSTTGSTPRAHPTSNGELKVRQHPTQGPYVDGLSRHNVATSEDAMKLLETGMGQRATAETKMNERSSRSHAIFVLYLTRVTLDATKPGNVVTRTRSSKINLVDLAGSERVGQTGAAGERLEEARNINRSLHTLGRVITALSERSTGSAPPHRGTGGSAASPRDSALQLLPSSSGGGVVPYRESVLTWLLADSLGGNSYTTMLATVSPMRSAFSQTLTTLRFASIALNIINSVAANVELSDAELIADLRDRVSALTLQLNRRGISTTRGTSSAPSTGGTSGHETTMLLNKDQLTAGAGAAAAAAAAARRIVELEGALGKAEAEAARVGQEIDRADTAEEHVQQLRARIETVEREKAMADQRFHRELQRRDYTAQRLVEETQALQSAHDQEKQRRTELERELVRRPASDEVQRAVQETADGLKKELQSLEEELARKVADAREADARREGALRAQDDLARALAEVKRENALLREEFQLLVDETEGGRSTTESDGAPLTTAPNADSPLSVSTIRSKVSHRHAELSELRVHAQELENDVAVAVEVTCAAQRDQFVATEGSSRSKLTEAYAVALGATLSESMASAAKEQSKLWWAEVASTETAGRARIAADEAAVRYDVTAHASALLVRVAVDDTAASAAGEALWRQRVASITVDFGELQKKHTETSREASGFKRRVEVLEGELGALQSRHEAMVDVLQHTQRRHEEVVTAHADELALAVDLAGKHAARISVLEQQRGTALQRSEQLSSQLDELQCQLLQDEASRASANGFMRSRMEADLAASEAKLESTQAELKVALDECNHARDVANAAANDRATLQTTLAELRQEAQLHAAKQIARDAALAAQEAELAQRVRKLEEERSVLRGLHAIEVRDLQAEQDLYFREYEEKRDELQKQMRVLSNKCATAFDAQLGAEFSRDEAVRRAEALSAELRCASAAKEHSTRRIEALEKQLSSQTQRLAEVEEALAMERCKASFIVGAANSVLSPIGLNRTAGGGSAAGGTDPNPGSGDLAISVSLNGPREGFSNGARSGIWASPAARSLRLQGESIRALGNIGRSDLFDAIRSPPPFDFRRPSVPAAGRSVDSRSGDPSPNASVPAEPASPSDRPIVSFVDPTNPRTSSKRSF